MRRVRNETADLPGSVAASGAEPTRRIRPPTALERISRNLYRRSAGKHAWWIMLYRSPATGRRVEMSLGPVALLSRSDAKKAVLKHRVALQEGRCPLLERQADRAARKAAHAGKAPTFRAVFALYLKAHESGWRNAKHRAQWSRTIETYAFPVLENVAVDRIGTGEVQQVLQPIWHEKTATASRLRGRIEAVLDFAKVNGWCDGENPARWKGHLDHLLPWRDKAKKNHAALPWQELPALYQTLAGEKDASALALRYVLLTLLRTGEALGTPAEGEIDRVGKTHVIPPERMKAGKEHRVPLTAAALEVLDQAEAIRTGAHLFSGARGGKLSDMVLLMKLRALYPNRKVTTHGMRSAFRDWCNEHGVQREVAERQLAHVVPNATEPAYLRTSLLDPRRVLMQRWTDFLLTPLSAAETKVVPLAARAG